MKPEDQVSSLAPSQRLKELGVKQESHFYWFKERDDEFYIRPYSAPGYSLEGIRKDIGENCSAFTVAELGEMLPRGFSSGRQFGKDLFECWPIFESQPDGEIEAEQQKFLQIPIDHEPKEADARAKTLIYLLEQGLVKP